MNTNMKKRKISFIFIFGFSYSVILVFWETGFVRLTLISMLQCILSRFLFLLFSICGFVLTMGLALPKLSAMRKSFTSFF